MGALLGGKSSSQKSQETATQVVNQTVPDPEKTADPAAVGSGRKAEDESLFGSSTPDLRVDRPADTAGSTSKSGSGLKLM